MSWLVLGAVALQLIAATMTMIVIEGLKPNENSTSATRQVARMQWYLLIFAIIIPVQIMIFLLLYRGLF